MGANSSPNAHRSPTPKPQVQRNQSNQRQQSKGNNNSNNNNTNSNTTSSGVSGNLAQTAALNNHRSNLTQAAVEHLHNMQQFGHTHHNLQHAVDYINLPQLGQNYATTAAATSAGGNAYDLVGMPSVLQQRMSMNSGSSNSLTSPHHQRLDQSPSTACAVNNFYLQNTLANESRGLSAVSHGTTSPASVGSQNAQNSNEQQQQQQQQQQQMLQTNNNNNMTANDGVMSGQQGGTTSTSNNNNNAGGSNGGTTGTQMVGNLCSLSKLQQLTNGLDIQQPCNTPPSVGSGQVNLTPPPNSHHAMPHANSMTPPPHLLVPQNRNLSTPPTMLQSAQMPPIQYHKYYSSNMNIGSLSAAAAAANNTNKQQGGGGGSGGGVGVSRNTPSAPLQHITAAAAAAASVSSTSPAAVSRTSNNVHLGSNLMTPYASSINSYRMSAQQPPPPTSAAAYTPGSEHANSQLPMQMGVMNSQYQDACAIQRAAVQQNSMYSTYTPTYTPYIGPLNGPMRR